MSTYRVDGFIIESENYSIPESSIYIMNILTKRLHPEFSVMSNGNEIYISGIFFILMVHHGVFYVKVYYVKYCESISCNL